MPNWKDPKSRERLLAALVASIDKKSLNYRNIATYYGEGTTYDAIEGQFRTIRKLADQLREAVGSGEQAEAPPRGAAPGSGTASRGSRASGSSFGRNGSGSIMTTPSRPQASSRAKRNKPDCVITGRITKSKSITPTNNSCSTKQWVEAAEMNNNNSVRGVKEEIVSSESSVAGDPMEDFEANINNAVAFAHEMGYSSNSFDFDDPTGLMGSFDGADYEWGV